MALTQALLMMFALGASPAPPPPGGDYIKVEIRGTLRSGMMAIGGETTGTVVSARGAPLPGGSRAIPSPAPGARRATPPASGRREPS